MNLIIFNIIILFTLNKKSIKLQKKKKNELLPTIIRLSRISKIAIILITSLKATIIRTKLSTITDKLATLASTTRGSLF